MKLTISPRVKDRSHPARKRAVEKWVLRHLGSLEHERRVKAIAGRLFDLTAELHGLGEADRRTLDLAAIVHDVGRCIDDRTHPQEGARMLRQARELPLFTAERTRLIRLTRLHRGKVDPDLNLTMRDSVLLALLQAADGLDSRAIESPKLVMAFRGRRLHITCYLEELTPKSIKVYGRRKKFQMLEELLDCRVEVNLVEARELKVVA